jgi:hypothetical protein
MPAPVDPAALDRLAEALARCLLAWWHAHQASADTSPAMHEEMRGADDSYPHWREGK